MGMTDEHLDQLDAIAEKLQNSTDPFPQISTGEKLYVAVAANRADLAKQLGYTLSEALGRLSGDDCAALEKRWFLR